jgi:peptidoglycan/LPS O-acetylase OafA/YrhL
MLTADLGGPVAKFLSLVPLVFLGEILYSLYLFQVSAPAISGLSLSGQGPYVASALPIFVYRLALGLLVAIAVAVGLYRVVERPGQRAQRAIGPQPKPATVRSMPTIPRPRSEVVPRLLLMGDSAGLV